MPTAALLRVLRSRSARRLLVVVVALVAGGATAAAWGAASRPLGPLQAEVGVVPAWSGGTRVEVPPLGAVTLATHRGPLQVRATLVDVRPDEARELLATGTRREVVETLADEARAAVVRGALRSAGAALLAGALAALVVSRRRREAAVGALAVAVVTAVGGAVAAATWRPEALSEPRFTGALAQAPGIVGAARDFDAYSRRVAELTLNVSRLYDTVATLPSAPAADAVRVLWVSDIHNSPQAFRLMAEVAEQFSVEAVLDTGDMTDLGSAVETRQLARVSSFGVPYVWVRGNHDSEGVTQAYLEQQARVVVLDDAEVVEVAGLRIAGTGHPLFRTTQEVAEERDGNRAALRAAGRQLAAAVERADGPVPLALVHEPRMAEPLAGVVPLVLTGHAHERRYGLREGTLSLTQGSTGGAGLRALDGEATQPLEMSVLHLDRVDGRLLAVDEVTVAGIGSRAVTVQRRDPSSYEAEEPADPTGSPAP